MDSLDTATGQAIARRRSAGSRVLIGVRDVLTASAIWTFIGVPVAGLLSLGGIVLILAGKCPRDVVTGAVLGAIHGLWLTLGGRLEDVEDRTSDWPGAVSGAILGLLGLPVVFSQMNSIVADHRVLVLLVIAVVCGGMVAGVFSQRVIGAYGPWDPPTPRRSAAVGCVLLLALGVVDYRLYWNQFIEKLPAPAVSHRDITNIGSGTAHGSQWSGCYQYTGEARGVGISSRDSGWLVVHQRDGELRVSVSGELPELRGRVEADGGFRVGSESGWNGERGSATRVLLEGRFSGASATYTRRRSISSPQMNWTWKYTGTARRVACPCSNSGSAR